jgi:hypothetical protein
MDWHLSPRSRLTEFDPDQLRIPGGMPGGGRWTKMLSMPATDKGSGGTALEAWDDVWPFPRGKGKQASARDAVDRSHRAIDKALPNLPEPRLNGGILPVEYNGRLRSTQGKYSRDVGNLTGKIYASKIVLGPNTNGETYMHEYGHYIDYELLSDNGQTATDWAMPDIMDAIAKSRQVKRLAAIDNMDPGSKRYVLQTNELWARAFSQWLALRSKDKSLMEDIMADNMGGMRMFGVSTQWEDPKDFAPIARAIDAFFKRKGWTA